MGSGLFFESRGDALYGFLHPAEGGPRDTGVAFVHGAFEERQDAHLVLRDAAARLAARGFNALRFDLYGHGDSAGEFEDATLSRWVDDTLAACDLLHARTGCRTVALGGLRLGAVIAARAAARLGAAATHVALWQPVTSGRAYALDVLRAHLATEMVLQRRAGLTRDALVARLQRGESVNVFGYRLSPALFAELLEADLATDLARSSAQALLVDVVRATGAPGSADLDVLVAALAGRAQLARVVEPQPLHAEGRLFLTRAPQVAAATERFLETAA